MTSNNDIENNEKNHQVDNTFLNQVLLNENKKSISSNKTNNIHSTPKNSNVNLNSNRLKKQSKFELFYSCNLERNCINDFKCYIFIYHN